MLSNIETDIGFYIHTSTGLPHIDLLILMRKVSVWFYLKEILQN